ncbi:MAG TPA: FAD-dependent oxidoreductase [Solirubrobacterales bacterium]|nr:FAD-dependent oxidoreductase [Solirubrobacterales bacterium]
MKQRWEEAGVVIVGGGLAGQRCAETLRRRGYGGPVRILCAESEPPYDRPPLSKAVLAGTAEEASVAFRPAGWYEENAVELVLSARAAGLEPGAQLVFLAEGEPIPYGKLLVASGGSPRRLPFLEGFENVHYLRSLADARRLRAELARGVRLAIVGAGFIGQEVAATALGLGAEVTIVEAMEVPLAPILGAELGRWFADLHQEEGARLLAGAMLEGAHGGDRVERLLLADGTAIECDVVVAGIGTAPATGWLQGSGLGERGVEVDVHGRTALPDVFAAGDASIPFDPRFGVHARTEHWDAAAWQGAAAAKAMLGEEAGTPPLPSFWSDQYGVRVQSVGHPHLADSVLVEGDPASRDFEAVLTREGVPVAGLTVGRPRAIPALRKRIEAGHRAALEKEEVPA